MAEQSLKGFVETHTLPARVKVTEGMYGTGQTDWEFSNGDVLDLQRVVCPTVELRYVDPSTRHQRTVTGSTNSPCLFRVLPYIPDQFCGSDRLLAVPGVANLVRIWPLVVCAGSSYNHGSGSVCKGDILRLKRLLYQDGVRLLECSTQRQQLLCLPLSCDLTFFIIEDPMAYTLAEIVNFPGDVERRLRLADDAINKQHSIRGLPYDVTIDLFVQPFVRFVEIHPAESPGENIVVPIDLDIVVCGKDDEYCGSSFRWYSLESFVDANHRKLPMVVSLADWDEEPISVQAIRVSVGDRMVLHRRQDVFKVACSTDLDRFYAVPLDYDATFKVIPRRFASLGEAYSAGVKCVQAQRNAVADQPGMYGVRRGNTIEFLKKAESGQLLVRLNGSSTVQLPCTLRGEYEEIPDGDFSIMRNLRPGMLPLDVTFDQPSASLPDASLDPIPRRKPVRLERIFADSCVLASRDADIGEKSFIPLRAAIYVRYISQYKKQNCSARLAAMSSCPEVISEATFAALIKRQTYENHQSLFSVREPPPITPRKHHLIPSTPTKPEQTVAPPGIIHVDDVDRQTRSAKLKAGKAAPVPSRRVVPPRPNTGQDVDDEMDYEDIPELFEYNIIIEDIFGDQEPPNVSIPKDCDISSLSWMEMVIFLQLICMPLQSLRLFAKDKISGQDFARLDNQQLAAYMIDYPIIRHFRNKSERRGPMSKYL